MNTSSLNLQDQGSPILLLAYLRSEFPQLPSASFYLTDIFPDRLEVQIHGHVRSEFEAWRVALGLPVPTAYMDAGPPRLDSVGTVADVSVRLVGFDTADEVAATVELAYAVALLGALPMPTGADEDSHEAKVAEYLSTPYTDDLTSPAPGALAEQRHLIDPLDHVLEHLADDRPTVVLPTQRDRGTAL